MLTDWQIQGFNRDGFVRVDSAFSSETAVAAREILWRELASVAGCLPHDPNTWNQPVVRLGDHGEQPYSVAASSPVLAAVFDQLVGVGGRQPRQSLGTFPVRFPSGEDSGDDGWHIDASYPGDDPTDFLRWRINHRSRDRALLLLFLFSDVGAKDALPESE